jgi:hypothetical protein
MENWESMTHGLTTVPVAICGVLVLFVSIYKIVRILGANDISKKFLNAIWLLGLLAFLIRMVGQLIFMSEMFYAFAIAEIPDLSAVANGLSESMLYSLSGLAVLIISLMFWGLIKALIVLKLRKTIHFPGNAQG